MTEKQVNSTAKDLFNNNGRQQPPFFSGVKMDKFKEAWEAYGLWAVFLGVVTIFIKPFVSVKQTLRDAIITFLISMLAGMLLEYIDIPAPVKYGMSGVCGLFAVHIYTIIEALLKQVEQDPISFFRRKKDD